MRHDTPLFSIVIPTYNRAAQLARALTSLNDQTFRDFEVLVCDDGSTDGTRAVAEAFSDKFSLSYLFNDNWGGPAKPRNRGIDVARGEWVSFLDSDDWWYSDKLSEVSRNMTEADVIYHDMDIYQSSIKRVTTRARALNLTTPVLADLLSANCKLYNSSVSVRKSILDAVGPISEDKRLIAAEDFDLWIRISRITDRFRRIPASLGVYCMGEDNLTEISEKQVAVIEAVFGKHLKDVPGSIRSEAVCFREYTVGRIRYKAGMLDAAAAHFKKSARSRNIVLRLKSLLLLGAVAVMKIPAVANSIERIQRSTQNQNSRCGKNSG